MPNRTLLIAGNWKMNNDVAEAAKLADELAQALPEVPAGVEVLVCPPTIDITTVHDRIQAAPIALGAQNVYWEAKGAFTGESSCDMLKSAGCTYCIIGHSERRDYFHETDEDQNKKAKALVAAGLGRSRKNVRILIVKAHPDPAAERHQCPVKAKHIVPVLRDLRKLRKRVRGIARAAAAADHRVRLCRCRTVRSCCTIRKVA